MHGKDVTRTQENISVRNAERHICMLKKLLFAGSSMLGTRAAALLPAKGWQQHFH